MLFALIQVEGHGRWVAGSLWYTSEAKYMSNTTTWHLKQRVATIFPGADNWQVLFV